VKVKPTVLGQAAVCSRLLKNTSDPDDRRKFEGLRERWKQLALQIWRLPETELVEQVKALSRVQASIIAEISQTQH
jgi:hypothetical protein